MRRTRIKVSKEASRIQFFVGIVFVILGIGMIVMSFSPSTSSGFGMFSAFNEIQSRSSQITGISTPMFNPFSIFSMIFKIFPFIWTAIAAFMTFNAYQAGFKNNGMAYYDIETEDYMPVKGSSSHVNSSHVNSIQKSSSESHDSDFEEKLRKIERLYSEGLISSVEYQAKRDEVMKEQW